MVWYSIPFRIFQLVGIHKVKGFGVVNRVEVDVFLELPSFFHGAMDVGNLISGSSAFSKTSLNIWKFTVHILLKPGLKNFEHYFTSVRCVQLYDLQFSSVAQSCPTLCDPVNCSMPGLPVHHQLPEFTQTRVHRVSDAIQPSHPRSSPSHALNPSQHQSLFQ